MSKVAITVTFDLHYVKPQNRRRVYTQIRDDLASAKMRKYIIRKSGSQLKLPANTFVGFFSGPTVDGMTSAQIRTVIMTRVKRIIESHHRSATIFVFVGRQWAWGKGRVAASSTKRA